MKTKREHGASGDVYNSDAQRGNALIYVLIAIVLFGALSFSLGRQNDSSELSELDHEKAKFYATQMTGYAAQVKSVVDQMTFTGTDLDEIDFTLPGQVGFNDGSHIHKVFHPSGGGLKWSSITKQVIAEVDGLSPVPGWYLGRFNNVDWTSSSAHDIILTAYQISQPVCEVINEMVTGSRDIPVLGASINTTLVDPALNDGQAAAEFTTSESSSVCEDCAKVANLCVQNAAKTAYAFYVVIADQ